MRDYLSISYFDPNDSSYKIFINGQQPEFPKSLIPYNLIDGEIICEIMDKNYFIVLRNLDYNSLIRSVNDILAIKDDWWYSNTPPQSPQQNTEQNKQQEQFDYSYTEKHNPYRNQNYCNHEMKDYLGLSEKFRYCVKCDYKEKID